MSHAPHIEIVLPIFNEAKNLPLLLSALDGASKRLEGRARVTYLFIDDGSSDGSAEFLRKCFEERPDIRIVELIHNFGHGPALACGVDHTEADISVFMDADLQDAPDALGPMFEAWKGGAKTVVAERGSRSERHRWIFQGFYALLHKLARQLPPFNFGTYCLLDRAIILRMRELKEKNRYFPGLVSYSSGPITPIRIDRRARAHGKSRVGGLGLLNLALTAYLSFSTIPVRLVSLLGLVCASAAVLSGLAIVGIKIFTELAIPGWASIMTATAFGSGIQLLCLGIIGEYVARIYDEVKGRPLYLVEKVREKKVARKVA